jgi:endogenous inhibitor of DNA gyrase (YacG/DUF329 family)
MENVNCPRCGTPGNTYCDNDCGTLYCERCSIDFYNGTVGHNDKCGDLEDVPENNLGNC